MKRWVAVGLFLLGAVGVALAHAQVVVIPQVYVPLVRGAEQTPTPEPTATLTPSPTPTLPPPSFNDCQSEPDLSSAPDYPVRIVGIDKVAETVTLFNESGGSINLDTYVMCSLTGNQMHPIGGILAPGATRVFTNTGAPIWNNDEPDFGALYNQQGQLVGDWSH